MTLPVIRVLVRPLSGLLLALSLAACAAGPDPRDPFEPFNRKVSDFNEAVDEAVLKPVATGYRDAVPALVRTGVSNFFGNLGDVWSTVNNALQLKPQQAAESWLRVGVNTVFGMGGVLDVASELRIERHREDFGQTLGRWGVGPGPYVVLPLLGPSTLRDTAALPVDAWGDPVRTVNPASAETGLYVLRAVDTRAKLLRATSMLESVALDKYTFTRDAYLQRRRVEVLNGESGSGAVEDEGNGGAEENYDAEPAPAAPQR